MIGAQTKESGSFSFTKNIPMPAHTIKWVFWRQSRNSTVLVMLSNFADKLANVLLLKLPCLKLKINHNEKHTLNEINVY